MNTTAVFAEHVVGGIQTLIWVGLVFASYVPQGSAAVLSKAPAVTVVVLLALAYSIGVVLDRVWDWLMDKVLARGIKDKAKSLAMGSLTPIDRQRQAVFAADPKTAAEFVEYIRSRMRVARASSFNFLFIAASSVVYVLRCERAECKIGLAVTLGAVFGMLCVVSYFAFRKLMKTYYKALNVVS